MIQINEMIEQINGVKHRVMMEDPRKRFFIFLTIAVCMAIAIDPNAYAGMDPDWTFDNLLDGLTASLSTWEEGLTKFARNVFVLLAIIELVWTFIPLVLKASGDITELTGELVRKMFFFGFFWYLLTNATYLSGVIWGSFSKLSKKYAIHEVFVNTPSNVFRWGNGMALDMITPTQESTKKAGVLESLVDLSILADTAITVLMTPFAVVMILMTCVFTVVLIAINLEFIFAGFLGIILLGFGSSRWTSQYAVNYFRYMFGVGLKYFFTVMMIGFVFNTTAYLADNTTYNSMRDVLALTCFFGIGLILTIMAPRWAAALVSGATGGNVGGAVWGGFARAGSLALSGGTAAAGMAMGTLKGGMGAAQAGRSAWKLAGTQQAQAAMGGAGGTSAGGAGTSSIAQAVSSPSLGAQTGPVNPGAGSGGMSAMGGAGDTTSPSAVIGNGAISMMEKGGSSIMGKIGSRLEQAGMAGKNLMSAGKEQIGKEIRGEHNPRGTIGGQMSSRMDDKEGAIQAEMLDAGVDPNGGASGGNAGGGTSAGGGNSSLADISSGSQETPQQGGNQPGPIMPGAMTPLSESGGGNTGGSGSTSSPSQQMDQGGNSSGGSSGGTGGSGTTGNSGSSGGNSGGGSSGGSDGGQLGGGNASRGGSDKVNPDNFNMDEQS